MGLGQSDLQTALGAAILGTVSDVILLADREASSVFWNPGATRIFGVTAGKAVLRGRPPKRDHALLGRRISRVGRGGTRLRDSLAETTEVRVIALSESVGPNATLVVDVEATIRRLMERLA